MEKKEYVKKVYEFAKETSKKEYRYNDSLRALLKEITEEHRSLLLNRDTEYFKTNMFKFMSEVDNEIPCFVLKKMYREKVIHEYEKTIS